MFYLFHGDDDHSKQKQLDELLSQLGDRSMLELNTTQLEGNIEMSDLRNACDAIPFLAARRIVIVRDLFARNPSKPFVDTLLDYLPRLPETTRLFFLESKKLSARHALVRFAGEQETGFVKLFERPEGGAVDRWVIKRVKEAGGAIAPRAAHTLAANIGNDLYVMSNEIEKLLLYVGTERSIEAEDVNLLCPYVAESSIFDLVDALGSRQGRKAAQLLEAKLVEGADPFYLFAMIVRQFRLLIQIKELAEQGFRAPAISKELKIHSFVAGKLFQQAQQFSLAQLEQIYAHLLEMDVGVKTGQADMVNSLSLLVAGLTTPVVS